jgi:hypothetical protein
MAVTFFRSPDSTYTTTKEIFWTAPKGLKSPGKVTGENFKGKFTY